MNDANAGAAAYRPLSQLLAAHAHRHAQRAAIVDVDRDLHISFGELAALVDGTALQLQAHGIKAGDRVVLLIDGGIETVLVWLALWRLAAVVCPFDGPQLGAAAPGVLHALDPALLLHGARVDAADLPAGVRAVLRFGPWPAVGASAGTAIRLAPPPSGARLHAAGAGPHDLAAACCTSGSSGTTKIVMHDHASYWLNGLDGIHLLGLREDDRLLEYRSLSWYSPQILSLVTFLQSGACLHIARQFSRSRFPDWIARHRITVAVGVPTVLNMLLNGPIAAVRESASTLRLMTCSSAPLMRGTWERFERESGIAIVNLYGSSEAGWIAGNRLDARRLGSVGRPAPHTAFDIVDADGRSCRTGEPGQVVVEGPKLAVGLLAADGSIAALRGRRFFPRDLARRDADGFIHLLGRVDDLVNRGGVKISPQEIEEALLSHADVAEAAAVGVPDAIYGQQARCFAVLREGATIDGATLLAHVGARLPREKRPQVVCIVDALPRTARGKLRRDLLRERGLASATTGELPQQVG